MGNLDFLFQARASDCFFIFAVIQLAGDRYHIDRDVELIQSFHFVKTFHSADLVGRDGANRK